MRKVSIRNLSRNFYASIGDLPLIITKNGKDYAKIELVDVVTQDVVTPITPVNPEPKNVVTIEDNSIDKPDSEECLYCEEKSIYFRKDSKGVCEEHYKNLNKVAKDNYTKK